MFCPVCQSEFRKGIDTCATCDVALVAQLSGGAAHAAALETLAASTQPRDVLIEHCGFLSLEDAREARATLRREGIPSEIVIRDAATAGPSAPPVEEFWLRIPAGKRLIVEGLLGDFEELEGTPDELDADAAAVACSDCGKPVAEDEATCPHCGAQFE